MSKKNKAKAYQTPAAKTSPKPQKMPVWVWLGLGVFLVIALTAAFALNTSSSPTADRLPAEISIAQAAEMRADGAFILDVRETYEWEELHIPDATLIPLGELESRVNELPRDQEIVVVCRSGNRSLTGRDILINAGFEQVTSMAGGMNQWRAQGFPIVSGP
jgi:rhodanese-related sulfurtransferase